MPRDIQEPSPGITISTPKPRDIQGPSPGITISIHIREKKSHLSHQKASRNSENRSIDCSGTTLT